MLIDDEPFVRQGLRLLIDWEAAGFEIVLEAQNGIEALALIDSAPIDLIILDIKMPGMDGITFLEALQQKQGRLPKIIILSGYFEYTYAQTALRYGVTDYLLKPIQPDELLSTLERIHLILTEKNKVEAKEKRQEQLLHQYHLQSLLLDTAPPEAYAELSALYKDETAFTFCLFCLNDPEFLMLPLVSKEQVFMKLQDHLLGLLRQDAHRLFMNLSHKHQLYEIGFLASSSLYAQSSSQETFFYTLYNDLQKQALYPLRLYVGLTVSDLAHLSDSAKAIEPLRRLEASPQEPSLLFFANTLDDNSSQLLENVQQYICLHYAEDLQIKKISEHFFINTAYLGQLFKKKYGMYLKDYITKVRVEKASKLLIETTDPIYQIAESVGYHKVEYFTAHFLKYYHTTPKKYRENYKGGDK